MLTLTATRVLDLEVPDGWDLITVAVGANADPLLLLWERPEHLPLDDDELRHPGVTAIRRRAAGPNRFRLIHYRPEGITTLDLPETNQNYYYVQPLPDETYLLIQTWPQDQRPNADVYDASGNLLRSWDAGGGIEHVQASTDGRVWIGYFDEGVYSRTSGRAGVNWYDAEGRVLLSYNGGIANGRDIPGIDDSYAMNVVSDAEIWLWYYMAFPLVRLIDGKITGFWPNLSARAPVEGAKGIAVLGGQVLFFGPYKQKDRAYLVSLETPRVEEVIIQGMEGQQIRYVLGRGSRLYFVTERSLFMVDAATLPP
jgi:hypothetical protein